MLQRNNACYYRVFAYNTRFVICNYMTHVSVVR